MLSQARHFVSRASSKQFQKCVGASGLRFTHTLPVLPYPHDALEPYISKETLAFHYDKHHAGYVTKLNDMESSGACEKKSTEEHVMTSEGGAYNAAAQILNHTFYWHSIGPNCGGQPSGKIKDLIDRDFGSFQSFKDEFSAAAVGHFGSGWAWLVQDSKGALKVVQTHDAGHPMNLNLNPILTCDVWEHAYYIDTRNDRPKYVNAWWNLVNWEFANKNLK